MKFLAAIFVVIIMTMISYFILCSVSMIFMCIYIACENWKRIHTIRDILIPRHGKLNGFDEDELYKFIYYPFKNVGTMFYSWMYIIFIIIGHIVHVCHATVTCPFQLIKWCVRKLMNFKTNQLINKILDTRIK